MDEIDLMIPTHIKDILSDLFSVIGTLFVVSYAMPIVIAIVIPMIALFLFIQTSYLATSRHGGLSDFNFSCDFFLLKIAEGICKFFGSMRFIKSNSGL